MPEGKQPDSASVGGRERFRGTSEVPLTADGIRSAQTVGIQLAQRGGLNEIRTSNLGRAVHTARIISQYTHAPITQITDGFHPWHVGGLEGQPVTPAAIQMLHSHITDTPDVPLPGRGPLSSGDGESFNQFKSRTLGALQSVIQQSSSYPDRKIGVVTHYRVKKLLDAWMRKGLDPNGDIDTDEMQRHDLGNTTGGVDRLSVDPYAGPQMSSVDLDAPGRLLGGIYLIRHGQTAWNSDES